MVGARNVSMLSLDIIGIYVGGLGGGGEVLGGFGEGVQDDADGGLAVAAAAADGEDLPGDRGGGGQGGDSGRQAAGGQLGDQGQPGARRDQAEQDGEVGGAGDHAGHEPGPGAGALDHLRAAGAGPGGQERLAGQAAEVHRAG